MRAFASRKKPFLALRATRTLMCWRSGKFAWNRFAAKFCAETPDLIDWFLIPFVYAVFVPCSFLGTKPRPAIARYPGISRWGE